MALRKIRLEGDPVLTKKCRPVEEMNDRTRQLMQAYAQLTGRQKRIVDAMGVGLAAPQVGILKRIVVIDVGEGPIVMVNPKIVETSGEQTGDEGCLSIPGMAGEVTRPNYVKAIAFDENMEEIQVEGTDLLARAICHECDHLDGVMYTAHVNGELHRVEYDEEDE